VTRWLIWRVSDFGKDAKLLLEKNLIKIGVSVLLFILIFLLTNIYKGSNGELDAMSHAKLCTCLQ
jgi:hypothetical protein